MEEGVVQAEEESSQEAIPDSVAMPELRMCTHCQSDSLIPEREQELLCMFVVREMLNPQVINKPSLEVGQPRHSYKKENLLERFPFGVKYGEMYPVQERTIDLAWFAVCKIKGPFAGRRTRLTDTTILSTLLLKSEWGI